MAKWPLLINQKMMDLKDFNLKSKESNVKRSAYKSRLPKLSKLSKSKIKFTIEDNKLKQNRLIPRSNIKIVDFNVLREQQPDYIIIFALNFVDDIIKKLKSNKLKNLKVVVPLPKLNIINL